MITPYKSMNAGCRHEKDDSLSRSARAECASESAQLAIEKQDQPKRSARKVYFSSICPLSIDRLYRQPSFN